MSLKKKKFYFFSRHFVGGPLHFNNNVVPIVIEK